MYSPEHARPGRWLLLVALAFLTPSWGCSTSFQENPDGSPPGDAKAAREAATKRDTASGDSSNGTDAADAKVIADAHALDALLLGDASTSCSLLDDPHELIADRRFRRGFVALDQKTHKAIGPMPTGFCKESPIWHIAQWDSLGDLSKAKKQFLSSGSVRWSNTYGRVTVGAYSSAAVDLALGVWAYKEYGGKYHTPNPSRVWVHLLAEQRISPPGVSRPGCPPLTSLSNLNFKMGARLLKDTPHHVAGYSPKKHAAQFLVYFTVQNLNKASSGFGDYLWFGLMPYDDRYTLPGIFIQGDLTGAMGTGKLIYNLGSSPFISVGIKPGGPEQIFAKDLLPHIRLALKEAWKRGYLKGSKVLSDYRIGGMNIGWEVPGLNDVEMKVRDLSLRYKTRSKAPVVFNFNTAGNKEGWTAVNLTDINGGPLKGKWILQVPGKDPHLISPALNLDAAAHTKLQLIVANDHNPAASSTLQVYWDRFGDTGFRESWSIKVPISNGGGWQTLNINMSTNPAWKGEISRIRIDPVIQGDKHAIGVDMISL